MLALVSLTLLATPAAAQTSPNRLTIAAKGGVALSKLKYSTDPGFFSQRMTTLVGGAVGFQFWKRLGAELDVLYLRKGADYAPTSATYTYDYVAVPVLLRLDMTPSTMKNLGVYALIGGSFDSLLQAKLISRDISVDLESKTRKSATDVVVGVGIEYKRLIAEGRYIGGVNNIALDLPGTIKSRTLAALAGFRFK